MGAGGVGILLGRGSQRTMTITPGGGLLKGGAEPKGTPRPVDTRVDTLGAQGWVPEEGGAPWVLGRRGWDSLRGSHPSPLRGG